MLIRKSILMIVTLFATSAVLATQKQPDVCPNTSVVKSLPFTETTEALDLIIAYSYSRFSTKNEWIFMIGPFDVKTSQEALQQSNALLPTLYGNPNPIQDGPDWVCEYKLADNEKIALAIEAPGSITHILNRLNR